MAYGYSGTMRTVPGRRDQVVQILVGSAAMPMLTGEFTSRETTVLGGLP